MKPLGLWTLPNAITWYRVLAAVPIILLLMHGSNSALWSALALMVVAEVSDGVDGWVARRYGQVSAVGKILDPMADSLYRISVFAAFTANRWMPVWMLLIMGSREIAMSYLRIFAELNVGTLAARTSGKIKAAAQGFAQICIVLAYAVYGPSLPSWADALIWLTLLLTTILSVTSLVDYVYLMVRKTTAGPAPSRTL